MSAVDRTTVADTGEASNSVKYKKYENTEITKTTNTKNTKIHSLFRLCATD